MNVIWIILFLFCGFSCSSRIDRVHYSTLPDSKLYKEQADTFSYMHKVKYYQNNNLKKIEYRTCSKDSTGVNKAKIWIVDYYLEKGEKEADVQKKYPKESDYGFSLNFFVTQKENEYTKICKSAKYLSSNLHKSRRVIKSCYILDKKTGLLH